MSCVIVIPAKAGIQVSVRYAEGSKNWIPAFAGMTDGYFIR